MEEGRKDYFNLRSAYMVMKVSNLTLLLIVPTTGVSNLKTI
jgi:hypothetical protein